MPDAVPMKGRVYASGRMARTSAKGESPWQGERWYVAEICRVFHVSCVFGVCRERERMDAGAKLKTHMRERAVSEAHIPTTHVIIFRIEHRMNRGRTAEGESRRGEAHDRAKYNPK